MRREPGYKKIITHLLSFNEAKNDFNLLIIPKLMR